MSHGAGPAEKMANQQSQQMMADRERELATNDQALIPFSPGPGGDLTTSPIYRSLVQTGRQSTARAYNTAKSAVRANAHSAGYGYEQPITQSADAGMERSEASDLSQVPRTALNDTAGMDLQASGIRSGEVSSSNPSSLTGTAVNAEQQRQNGLMQSLLGLGKLGANIGLRAAGVPGGSV